MQLLENHGIDLQLPNKWKEIDLTDKIKLPEYDREDIERLVGDYLQYNIQEPGQRDQKFIDMLYGDIQWFLDTHGPYGHNVLELFLTPYGPRKGLKEVAVRIELWRDKESFKYYLTHLMDHERPEIYSVIGFYMEYNSVIPFNKNGYYPNGPARCGK